ncbi:MAG: hypothetical protein IK152_08580 [Lachnospiraceae bacterium]|nr:hypothetical protein [Lachnospiraceae bacterium]
MNISELTGQITTTYNTANTGKKSGTSDTTETKKTDDTAAVYEPSAAASEKSYKTDTAKVQQMLEEAESKTEQLRSLVEKMMGKQGLTLAKADDMWSFLANGDFTVDEETRAQAQKDIAEDGYWGAEATSERILSFAMALTGGDPDKIEDMKDAFIKGFKEATKAWGKELPELSQQTYDKVMEKFDAWSKENE